MACSMSVLIHIIQMQCKTEYLLYVSTPWDLTNQGHFAHICIVWNLMWHVEFVFVIADQVEVQKMLMLARWQKLFLGQEQTLGPMM